MKKVNVTFTIPLEINKLLHSIVGRRKISSFVAQALHNALKEELEVLKKAYEQAEQDPDRRALIKDWDAIDIEGWE